MINKQNGCIMIVASLDRNWPVEYDVYAVKDKKLSEFFKNTTEDNCIPIVGNSTFGPINGNPIKMVGNKDALAGALRKLADAIDACEVDDPNFGYEDLVKFTDGDGLKKLRQNKRVSCYIYSWPNGHGTEPVVTINYKSGRQRTMTYKEFRKRN